MSFKRISIGIILITSSLFSLNPMLNIDDKNISCEEKIDDIITEIDIDEETDRAIELADDNNTSGFEPYLLHLDVFHNYLSHKVQVVSSNIDTQLVDTIHSFETNKTNTNKKPIPPSNESNETKSKDMSEKFNRFFNDETYLDANNVSFLMIRLGYGYDRLDDSKFINKIRFSLKLPKSGDQLNIFFGDDDEDINSLNEDFQTSGSSSLGIRYFFPTKIENLKTNLSVGIKSLTNPYVRIRFEYPINYKNLYIRPIQYLKYSLDEEFEEKTDLFFDYKSTEKEMIRLHLQRETRYDQSGMLFYAGLVHLNIFNKNEGLQTYISLSGLTKNDIDPETVDYEPKTGVNSYSVGALWRERIFRKYLFVDIEPIINFAQRHHYKSNPILKFNLELYFGNI